MKKIFLSVCAAILVITVVMAQEKKEEIKLSYREVGSILPSLRVIDTLKHEYSEADFSNKHHFFVFLFNPTCGHCIKMAKLVNDNKDMFRKNNVLFMAGPAMMPYLPSFYQASGLDIKGDIKVGIDSASAVDRLYQYRMLPQINIYDKDRRLIKVYYGDVALDSLKKYIP